MSIPELPDAIWRKSSRSGGNEGSCVEVAEIWQKSSYSGGDEGSCVEVAEAWQKSSHSGASEGSCVELAGAGRMVAARDSKDPGGPVLCFGVEAWRSFAGEVKGGAYDLVRV
ncbi:DUF397 domain-containing protein [Actinomadura yumaensis]|uniref:DUF397 domain-containing protein n=1 Tax=Actinomadura yumaensis TaxID=111807 RepID=A0ABW2CW13_9ACTN